MESVFAYGCFCRLQSPCWQIGILPHVGTVGIGCLSITEVWKAFTVQATQLLALRLGSPDCDGLPLEIVLVNSLS